MADELQVTADILTALRSIRDLNGRLHDGYVPTKIPTDAAGYVLPYVVFFGGIGDHFNERATDGTVPTDGLVYDFQTTCVGPGAAQVLAAAQLVRRTLINRRTGTGRIIPNPDGFNQQSPIPDTTITPVRFMLPLQWRLLTN